MTQPRRFGGVSRGGNPCKGGQRVSSSRSNVARKRTAKAGTQYARLGVRNRARDARKGSPVILRDQRGNIMQWTWTRRLWHSAPAAIAGATCWAVAVAIGLGQATSPSADTSQTNRSQSNYSNQPGTSQYGSTQPGS